MTYLSTAMSAASLRVAELKAASSPSRASGGRVGPSISDIIGEKGSLSTILTSKQNNHAEQYQRFRGWQYCAIRAIATRVASQPVMMGRKKSSRSAKMMSGRKGISRHGFRSDKVYSQYERAAYMPNWVKSSVGGSGVPIDKITDHPLLSAIDSPNDLMTRWQMLFVTIASLELTGLAYWMFSDSEDEDTGEMKMQIWPIPVHWVDPVHEVSKGKGKFFAKYKIGSGVHKKIISGNLIARFALPDPSDPMESMSPLQTQDMAISADEMIQQSQWRQFKNGINPGLALIVGDLPKDPVSSSPAETPILEAWQRKELIEAVRGLWSGVVNSREPLILDGLIKDAKQISPTVAEMDYLQSGSSTKSRIMQSYSINPLVLGEIQGGNRAQAATAEENLATNALNPVQEMMGQVITKSIPAASRELESVPDESGTGIVFWFVPCRPNDSDQRREEYTATPGPAVTVNEYRQNILMLEPIEDGDVCAEEYLSKRVQQPGAQPGGEPSFQDQQPEDVETKPQPKPSGQPKSPKPKSTKAVRPSRPASESMASDAYQMAIENRMSRNVQSVFDKYMKAAIRDLKSAMDSGKGPEQIVSAVFRHRDMQRDIVKACKPTMKMAMAYGAASEIQSVKRVARLPAKSTKASPDLLRIPEIVVESIDSEIEETFKQSYWSDVSKTTRNRLRKTLERELANGSDMDEIADEVRKVFGNGANRKTESQARNIARTEVTGAVQGGRHSVVKALEDAGLKITREWRAMFHRTRMSHANAHGQRPDKKGLFHVGGSATPYPGWYGLPANERCGCRCSAMIVDADFRDVDMDDETSDQFQALAAFGLVERKTRM